MKASQTLTDTDDDEKDDVDDQLSQRGLDVQLAVGRGLLRLASRPYRCKFRCKFM